MPISSSTVKIVLVGAVLALGELLLGPTPGQAQPFGFRRQLPPTPSMSPLNNGAPLPVVNPFINGFNPRSIASDFTTTGVDPSLFGSGNFGFSGTNPFNTNSTISSSSSFSTNNNFSNNGSFSTPFGFGGFNTGFPNTGFGTGSFGKGFGFNGGVGQ